MIPSRSCPWAAGENTSLPLWRLALRKSLRSRLQRGIHGLHLGRRFFENAFCQLSGKQLCKLFTDSMNLGLGKWLGRYATKLFMRTIDTT
jgi:hypothetical protein